jgi:hypothetical protein
MKFFELKISDIFEFDGNKYMKVKEEKLTCCKVKLNAKKLTNGIGDVVVKPLQDVTKIEEPSESEENNEE